VFITYPITHHWLTGFCLHCRKNANISNFEFFFHECTLCVANVCWEICGLSGLCLMKGAEIKWHLINLCRKFGHGSDINSWHLAAKKNVKVYEIECCSSMEYNCNHCGALKFNSTNVLSNHQRSIVCFSSQRNLEHTCKRVNNTNLQAFELALGTSKNQPKCNQSIYDYMRLIVICD
jgi:hypothetical protein